MMTRDDIITNKLKELDCDNILTPGGKIWIAIRKAMCEYAFIQNQTTYVSKELFEEKVKEAYTDGFSDSHFDFDIENYTQNTES